MSVFAGVDQSLTKTGVCVLRDGDVVHTQRIRVSRKLRGPARLVYLRDQLQEILLPFKNHIRHASLEAQSLGSIGDLDQLGQVSGMVQVVLSDMGVHNPFKVPPATLKKFVAGHPQASKERMLRATEKVWGLAFDNDDVCDAHGLARISEEYVERKSILRHQLEAVHSLSHPRKRKPRIKKLSTKTV